MDNPIDDRKVRNISDPKFPGEEFDHLPLTIQACPEGLKLLREFAEQSPTLYELAHRVDFIDPVHPGFKKNQRWLDFATHYSTCPNCNEV